MRNEKASIKIDPEIMDQLQRTHYDVQTRQTIIATLMENHAMDNDASVMESAAFKSYHKELEEAFVRLELLKSAITEEFIPQEFRETSNARWEADFASGELVILA